MECPRCHGNGFTTDAHVSRPCATLRQEGIAVAVVYGGSCSLCGHWEEPKIEPVITRIDPPRRQDKPVPPKIATIHAAVVKYRDSITRLREQGTSWKGIALLVGKAEGVKMHRSTLQSHFLKLG